MGIVINLSNYFLSLKRLNAQYPTMDICLKQVGAIDVMLDLARELSNNYHEHNQLALKINEEASFMKKIFNKNERHKLFLRKP